MRDGFRESITGWVLTDDVEGLGDYIEASAAWVKANGGDASMLDDERDMVRMMIQCQAARGIARGDFEPFISSDTDLLDILNFNPERKP